MESRNAKIGHAFKYQGVLYTKTEPREGSNDNALRDDGITTTFAEYTGVDFCPVLPGVVEKETASDLKSLVGEHVEVAMEVIGTRTQQSGTLVEVSPETYQVSSGGLGRQYLMFLGSVVTRVQRFHSFPPIIRIKYPDNFPGGVL